MSSAFYASIIEEEKVKHNITNSQLKLAAKSISINYSKKSLKKGTTYLDFSEPENRCAYLYKYGALHTGLVTKYFRKLVRKKQVKSILNKNSKFKICCLGGGPGTDIVGLFKALAVMPSFEKRISEVSVLDICKGWDETLTLIIEKLIDGKVEGVPETFVNKQKFKQTLREVDLLGVLPTDVKQIISSANIICMVKFVSAILAKQDSMNALQVLGNLIKPEAVVLFIDNFEGNIFQPIENISGSIGLEAVLGPLHERFVRASQTSLDIYDCRPQTAAKVSVIGWIKSSTCFKNISYPEKYTIDSCLSNEESNWESGPSSIISYESSLEETTKEKTVLYVNKNTQTDQTNLYENEELLELLVAISDLVTVLEKIRKV